MCNKPISSDLRNAVDCLCTNLPFVDFFDASCHLVGLAFAAATDLKPAHGDSLSLSLLERHLMKSLLLIRLGFQISLEGLLSPVRRIIPCLPGRQRRVQARRHLPSNFKLDFLSGVPQTQNTSSRQLVDSADLTTNFPTILMSRFGELLEQYPSIPPGERDATKNGEDDNIIDIMRLETGAKRIIIAIVY